MSTLYYCLVERRNFGDLMSAEGVSRLDMSRTSELDRALQQSPASESILAVWSTNPLESGQLPELLVCSDGTETDWAAWITTFGSKIRPFSAYMRLISYADSRRLLKTWRLPTLERFVWPVSGLVLGEILAASRLPDKVLETIPALVCTSTLSFAVFRAAAAYSRFDGWPQLLAKWDFVREVTRQRTRTIESATIARICATILDAAGLHNTDSIIPQDDINVQLVCQEIISSPERVPPILARIPLFAAAEEKMHGSREERVVAFNHFVRNVGGLSARGTDLVSLMLGYLSSRIAPGTMKHSTVLSPVIDRYPSALLWYGFCAGLSGIGNGDALKSGGRQAVVDFPASARRVARELLRPEPLVNAPSCDLSVVELLALSRTGRDPLDGLITTTQSTVTVELEPGVWTTLSVSAKSNQSETQTRPSPDRELLAAMGEHIERLRGTYQELMGGNLPDDERGQRSLFVSKRKRR